MERLGQGYGYILYRAKLSGERNEYPLSLQDVHDRAQVFVDGTLLGIVDRNSNQELPLSVLKKGITLDVLVESLGRINYGSKLKDFKGITEGIKHSR